MTSNYLRKSAVSALLAALLLPACGGEKPEASIASAKDYLAKNDAKAAAIQLKNALQNAPNLPEARFLLGKALLESGDGASAEVELRKAMELRHAPDQVVPLLAKALLYRGKAKEMVEEFGKVELGADEAKAELSTLLSNAYASLGNTEAAKSALNAALAAKPDHGPALLLQARVKTSERDLDGALALVDSILAKSPSNVEALKFKGDVVSAQGKQDEALEIYRKVLELRADYLPAHASIVSGLILQGKYDEAANQLAAMKKTGQKTPQTLFLDAQLAYQKKDYKLARESLQQFHKVAPPLPLSLQLAGATEYQLGAYSAAEDHLQKALQASPNLAFARRLLTSAYLRMGQAAKAQSTLQPILGKIDNSPAMLSLAGDVYIQSGDFKKAEEFYSKAAKLDPKDSSKRTRLALAHMAKGNVEGAFGELEDIAASDTGTTADLALISAHLRRNEIDKALAAVDVLAKKRTDDPAVFNMRGQILQLKKDASGARKNFEQALTLKPAFFPAAASLASLDLAESKAGDAKRRFDAVLAADPKNVQAYLALAELQARDGAKVDDIAATISKAVAANPTDPVPRLALVEVFLRSKDAKKAVVAAQDAMAAIPDRPELAEVTGRAQLAAGDHNQALITFNKLSTMVPTSPVPYTRMAEVQVATKNRDAAIQSLRKGLELKPDFLEGQRPLIALYVEAGKFQEANDIARTIQKQRPKDHTGYGFEGDIAVARKQWGDAAKAYRAALERSPVTELAIKLHTVLNVGGSKAEADKHAVAWIKDHPKDIGFRNYLAELAGASKDWSTAMQHYRVMLEAQPANPVILNNMAWVAGQMKDPKAIEYAEKANKLAPDQPVVMDTLAMLLAEKGDAARAIEILSKAVELGPNAPGIRLNLARLLTKAGNKVEARRHLDELAKLGDKFPAQADVAKLMKEL